MADAVVDQIAALEALGVGDAERGARRLHDLPVVQARVDHAAALAAAMAD